MPTTIGSVGYYASGWQGNSGLTFDADTGTLAVSGAIEVAGVASATVPLGAIMMMSVSTVPSGWLECDGQSTSGYADLAALIGANVPDLRGEFIRGWDNGRGVDSGRSIGSTQSGATALPSTDFSGSTSSNGSHSHTGTTDSGGNHNHTGTTSSAGAHTHNTNTDARTGISGGPTESAFTSGGTDIYTSSAGAHTHSFTTNSGGSHTHTFTTNSTSSHTHTVTITGGGDSETRPRNVALMFIIKA